MLQWYVICAKTNQVHLATRALREQDFPDVYVPKTYRRGRQQDGKVRPTASLLMPPYFFVLMDTAKGHHDVLRNVRAINDVLRNEKHAPQPLRDGHRWISKLRQAEDDELAGAMAVAKNGRVDLSRGQTVRIIKPGLLTRDASGQPSPIIGPIVLIERRKVTVEVGNMIWTVGETEVEPE